MLGSKKRRRSEVILPVLYGVLTKSDARHGGNWRVLKRATPRQAIEDAKVLAGYSETVGVAYVAAVSLWPDNTARCLWAWPNEAAFERLDTELKLETA
jgi:hypothetical protein